MIFDVTRAVEVRERAARKRAAEDEPSAVRKNNAEECGQEPKGKGKAARESSDRRASAMRGWDDDDSPRGMRGWSDNDDPPPNAELRQNDTAPPRSAPRLGQVAEDDQADRLLGGGAKKVTDRAPSTGRGRGGRGSGVLF